MTRWTTEEHRLLDILKERLKEELAASPQFPEVVGERKLVRFLRGHNHDLEKVYGMMKDFLQWRKDNHINDIRTNIVQNGYDHPLRFPKGEIILKLIPQLVVLPEALDKTGSPICVEQYNFVPAEVFKFITIEDYIEFVKYSLEYRSLVVEQLSEHREQAFLATLTPAEREALEKQQKNPGEGMLPYGVLVNTCVIRDLDGVGFAHLGSQGQEIIKTVVNMASANYPELMRKCFMINTPFIFNAVWYVIKGLLAARTIAKVSVWGAGYLDELLLEIDRASLPAMVGGDYTGYVSYTPFAFDLAYFVPGHVAVDPVIATEESVLSTASLVVETSTTELHTSFPSAQLPITKTKTAGEAEGESAPSVSPAATVTATSHAGEKRESSSASVGNTPSAAPRVATAAAAAAEEEAMREEIDMNIISLRTSGY